MSRTVDNSGVVQVKAVRLLSSDGGGCGATAIDLARARLYRLLTHERRRPRPVARRDVPARVGRGRRIR